MVGPWEQLRLSPWIATISDSLSGFARSHQTLDHDTTEAPAQN